ncbi:MAG: DUF2148 domain-containing protein [Desulfobacterales bacterium]
MARIDGKDAARDAVLEIVKLAAAAAYRAPMLTGRLDLKTEIITGEDQDPIIEYFEEIKSISPVMYFDYETLKQFRDKGLTVPILLLGADLTRSDLAWDCGACGFASCAEFNAFAKKDQGKLMWGGPTCNWKLMDFSAACDFACATVAQHRLDCRPMGTVGAAAAGVGFLPDCSIHIGIPIGPAGDFIYFSRSQNVDSISYEDQLECLIRTSPTNWQAFPGSTKPAIKTRQDWYNGMEYVQWGPPTPEEQKFAADCLAKVAKVAEKHFPKVASWYTRKKDPDTPTEE